MSSPERMDVYTPQAQEVHMPERSMFELVFPADHVLCKLQHLSSEGNASIQPLHLNLFPDEFEPPPFSLANLVGDKERLRSSLSSTAQARLDLLSGVHAPQNPIHLDEAVFVFLSSDSMAAWLFLFPPVGQGKTLTTPQLYQILIEHGIVHGTKWNFLRSLPAHPQRYFQLFPIALGTPPVPGEDGCIIDRFPRSLEGDLSVSELDQANYVTLKLVQDIQEGDVICEITPPTRGSPGSTVTGKLLPTTDGQAAVVPQGRNTRLSDDGRYLLATRKGHICFSGRSFQVKPVLELSESELPADRSIKFLGDVHIHGDLCGGISICAIGTVQIDGVVEACTIEAGEHIIVSSGVQGQDRAVLHAKKSVFAKYLEHCSVYAQESVRADCIINCNVYSNGSVRARTGRGVLIGGVIRAAQEVSATTIGSKAERPTSIVLGGQPCEEAERTQVLSEIDNLDQALSQLEKQSQDSSWRDKLSKLRLNQCVAKMKLEKFDKELEERRASALATCDQRRLTFDTAYPGTTVSIDHSSFRVSQVEHNCTIGMADGIVCRL